MQVPLHLLHRDVVFFGQAAQQHRAEAPEIQAAQGRCPAFFDDVEAKKTGVKSPNPKILPVQVPGVPLCFVPPS
jgi:hypothetical protein